ncbi:MAG TPA: phosphate acyltransferase, partial [Gemmatimonadota bacterium]|nr:phosphate acyltransferase [Gemmatimonadota bacterium]
EILRELYPFARLTEPANVLVFPDLAAANVCYKLLHRLGGAEAIGPVLLGMDRPVHILQRGSTVTDIANLAAISVVDAQARDRTPPPDGRGVGRPSDGAGRTEGAGTGRTST